MNFHSFPRLLAAFFGTGFVPKAPGTAASLASGVLWTLLAQHVSPWTFVLCVAGSAPILFWAVSAYMKGEGKEGDPKEIVADEVLGMGIALLSVAPSWTNAAIAFALFRLFDIVKPPPVRQLERLPGAWGVMADDLAAGFLANVVLHVFLRVL